MEYLALNNGVRMPLVGFGTWTLRGSEGETCVQNPSCKAVLCTVTDDMARSRIRILASEIIEKQKTIRTPSLSQAAASAMKRTSRCAADCVWVGEDIAREYYRDEMPEYGVFPPELYVEVVNRDEVSAIMKYAWENNIPVVCRGAGTGLAGGATCKYGGMRCWRCRLYRPPSSSSSGSL